MSCRFAFSNASERKKHQGMNRKAFCNDALRKVKRVNIFLNDDKKIDLKYSLFIYSVYF